jgi:hypothetical protein
MKPQGRRGTSQASREKTAGSRMHVQGGWAECRRQKSVSAEPDGEIFFLTFPFRSFGETQPIQKKQAEHGMESYQINDWKY